MCQEIQDELGVLPIRFKYRSMGMQLAWYQVDKDAGEAILEYSLKNDKKFHVIIYEKNDDSRTESKYDGIILERVLQDSLGKEVPVYELEGSSQGVYYESGFEYLNTYYEISSDVEKEEFEKIIENILIKSE